MILIDKISWQSRFRKKSPGLKCFFSISILTICVFSRSVAAAILSFLLMGGLTVFSGISLSRWLHFLKIPSVFLLMSSIVIIINISGQPLSWFAIPVGSYYITISKMSFLYGIQLAITAFASISCLYFLSLTTPMTDIIYILKKLHCPFLIIELMLLIYRFIFIMLDLASALTTAKNSRLGNSGFKTSCLSIGNMISVLFIRSMQQSGKIYDAMEARCYDGIIPILEESYKISKAELMFVLLCILAIGITAILWRNL